MWCGVERGRNVIEMSRFHKDNRFPEIAEVEAYWTALRGARAVPARIDIDPRGIEGALSHTFLLERVAPGVGRLRLAGMHLNDLLGMEVRGMPLSALFAPQHRARIADLMEQVCACPAIADLTLTAERGIGKPALEARMKMLPLTDSQGRVTRILGCLSMLGHVGRAPRRLMIASDRLTLLDGRVVQAPQPEAAGFAEPAQPFERADRRHLQDVADKHPYLRLIKSEG
ncbi:hypothetical protein SAMN04488092_101277 [Thalassovita taeanensis]|uniref:PAS domain-containing protein n=2 Tax=Thalassovita taeanensis TaxID=657014 RepID=A0A1H8Z2Y8_9RHOB|nr:hypothetical protein SAMN04488092_101277 [Thalassovita taeanensis]